MSKKSKETYFVVILLVIVIVLIVIMLKMKVIEFNFSKTDQIKPFYCQETVLK